MRTRDCIIYTLKILVVCLLFSVMLWMFYLAFPKEAVATSAFGGGYSTVIIDAGHGGRDGGASSEGGIVEKDVNLSVSVSLCDILSLCGTNTVMTRTSDSLVCDENDPSLKGKLKATDLKNRLKIAEGYPEGIFVSIHMNKFSVEKYSGLQVYYSPNNEKSFDIAKAVQGNVKELLQNDNDRKIKKATSSIFLLDRIKMPGILIECGFLSNKKEAEKLADKTYQTMLSLIIAHSILECDEKLAQTLENTDFK